MSRTTWSFFELDHRVFPTYSRIKLLQFLFFFCANRIFCHVASVFPRRLFGLLEKLSSLKTKNYYYLIDSHFDDPLPIPPVSLGERRASVRHLAVASLTSPFLDGIHDESYTSVRINRRQITFHIDSRK